MRTTFSILLTVILSAVPQFRTHAVEPVASLSVPPSHAISSPLITMTFVMPEQGAARQSMPEIAITADGRVSVRADARSPRTVTGQLPADEWRRIQHVLFVQNRMMDCEARVMEQEIADLRRQRRRPAPGADSAITVFTLKGATGEQTIRCHALGLTATQLPDLQCVQSLCACQECLQNVVKVVRAGGYEQVEETLSTVNQKLKRQLPGTDPLSSEDLNLVDARPDGTKYLQFSRLPATTNANGTLSGLRASEQYLMVSVYERPGRPLEISIIGDTASQ
ncbi:MAG: hypothetical protein KDA93_12335 [Planctomycetaceae bacterium]|nr:hypothetical protein [Planctomycetaceae bacterium]